MAHRERELPRYAVLQSCITGEYMKYVQDEGEFHGCILFNGGSVDCPFGKIEFEDSEIVGAYNIKCCYNNKYWNRKLGGMWSRETAIVADANKEEKKRESYTCTLFKVEIVKKDPKTIRIRHMGSKMSDLWVNKQKTNHLFAGNCPDSNKKHMEFQVINLDNYFVLPRHVAFKGNNGKYLQACAPLSTALSLLGFAAPVITLPGFLICEYLIPKDVYPFQQFSSSDRGSSSSHYQVFPNPDGSVRIKSKELNQFLKLSPTWIWADGRENTTNDYLFWPVKFKDGDTYKLALRNLGNNNFVRSLTADGKSDCLNACTSTICNEATLEAEELVKSREIYRVRYHISSAKISNKALKFNKSAEYRNATSMSSSENFRSSYTKITSKRWSSTVSTKFGVAVSLKASIPSFGDGEIKVSTENEKSETWGKTEEVKEEDESMFSITVPPMKKVIAQLVCTECVYDVPFSYTQQDTLYDGTSVTLDFDDGMFSCTNVYNFKVDTKEEPIIN